MTDTTVVPAAKTAPAWVTDLVGVVRTLVNNSAMQTADKTNLHDTLDGVAVAATGVVEEAPALAEAGVGELGDLATAAVTKANPTLGGIATVAEEVTLPAIEAIVGNALASWENTLISHNKNTIAAVGTLLGSPSQTVANAQAQIVPTT